MKKISLTIALLITPIAAQAFPWNHDMANQVSIKPQESVSVAKPGMALFPKRSVPVPGVASTIKDRDVALKAANPVPADDKSVAMGGKLFAIYCVPCHGKSGTGDGLVGAKLSLKPFDLTTERIDTVPDGHIWGYMTFGGAVMPSYANDLSPAERWSIVNYVRKGLKKAQPTQAMAAPAAK